MKFLAAMLAVLILTLTAGVDALRAVIPAPEPPAAGCCCDCGCESRDDGAQEQREAGHEGRCPFCFNNNSPAFTAAFTVLYQVCLTEIGHKENIFIVHKYADPLVKGVWQPPRAA